jgi:hypothetical protein
MIVMKISMFDPGTKMNERIRELEAQCWEYKPGFEGQEDWYTVFNKQKFAELIVRECMSINTRRLFSDYEGDSHRVAHNNALWCAWGDMKEHFGVES